MQNIAPIPSREMTGSLDWKARLEATLAALPDDHARSQFLKHTILEEAAEQRRLLRDMGAGRVKFGEGYRILVKADVRIAHCARLRADIRDRMKASSRELAA